MPKRKLPDPYGGFYNSQKQHAKRRGIEWQFTHDTWFKWWGDDIEKRGSKAGQLVMARYNDCGPYHPDNCRKVTVEENILEARRNGRGFFQTHTPESRAKISEGMKEVRAVKSW
jgi:hypothetical protein